MLGYTIIINITKDFSYIKLMYIRQLYWTSIILLTAFIPQLKNMCFSVLGDRIKYASPDCGLAFWPDQDIAFKLLENTAKGIDQFNAERKD